MESPPSVIIVGGGISGLVAARAITRSSPFRVILLESSERVGGRTLGASSALLPAVGVDAGGQWIGARQFAAQELVRDLQIKLVPQYCTGRRVLQIGDRVTNYSGLIPSVSLCQLIDAQLALVFISLIQGLLWLFGDDSFVGRWANGLSMRRMISGFMFTEAGRALVLIIVLGLFGHNPEGVSLLAFCRYVRANDSIERMSEIGPGSVQAWTCLGGAWQISVRLAQQVRAAGAQIHFGQRATDIQLLPDGLGVRVVCQSGSVFTGACVIVAIPPPLVGRIAFSPPLSPARASLLQDATMGCIIKTTILYRLAFWRAAGFSGEVIGDAVDGPVFNVFDACAPVLKTALDPSNPQGITYAGPTTSDPAVRLGPEYTYVPALVVFINGDRAREWSTAEPAARRAAVLKQLERWFGAEAGTPLEYIEKDWAADEHTRGCPIATYGPGVLERYGLGKELSEPCWPVGGAHRLHWAGTETSTVGTGFMDGAAHAGDRAGKAAVDALRRVGDSGTVPTGMQGTLSTSNSPPHPGGATLVDTTDNSALTREALLA